LGSDHEISHHYSSLDSKIGLKSTLKEGIMGDVSNFSTIRLNNGGTGNLGDVVDSLNLWFVMPFTWGPNPRPVIDCRSLGPPMAICGRRIGCKGRCRNSLPPKVE
jgi:hypothetical protein